MTERYRMNSATEHYVRQIVGRYHVGETDSAVIRKVIDSIRGGLRSYQKEPREKRHALLRFIVDVHAENFVMYAAVMSGKI